MSEDTSPVCDVARLPRPDNERLNTLMQFMYEQHRTNGPGAEVTVNAREMELIIDELFDNRTILKSVRDALREERYAIEAFPVEMNSRGNRHPTDLLERFSDAQSDVVCWLDGFTSAGKEYGPGTLGTLRAIKRFFDRLGDIL